MTSGSVSIVLTTLQVIAVVVLEFLLEWQGVEFPSQGKLAVHFFLADVEVFDVEEACYMSNAAMCKMLALYLPTCWTAWLNCLTSSSFPPGCSYKPRSRVINSAQSTVAHQRMSCMGQAHIGSDALYLRSFFVSGTWSYRSIDFPDMVRVYCLDCTFSIRQTPNESISGYRYIVNGIEIINQARNLTPKHRFCCYTRMSAHHWCLCGVA